MGLSSNQARFLSLTARQVDLENRVQQICQRRLRLASELEKVATEYNNSISNRKMFTPNVGSKDSITVSGLNNLGFKVVNNETNKIVGSSFIKGINQLSKEQVIASGATAIDSIDDIENIANTIRIGNLPGATAGQIAARDAVLAGNYALTNDIDLSKLDLNNDGTPDGELSIALFSGIFTGNFDGNGHSISNLNINTHGAAVDNIGLFAQVTGGKISNLIVDNANINATGSTNVAGIVGQTGSNAIIENIYFSGNISGDNQVGGIVGYNYGSTVSDCASEGSIAASRIAGGVVGINVHSSTLQNSYSTADISGLGSYKGSWMGGLIGVNNNSLVTGCYSTGDVVGGEHSLGGFVGENQNSGTITNSYSTGDVSATVITGLVTATGIGSFAGYNTQTSSITNSYATGDVSAIPGINYVKAFVGANVNGATSNNTNFYQNNMSTTDPSDFAVNANLTPVSSITGSWNTSVWDLSGSLPDLKGLYGGSSILNVADLEQGLRDGRYSVIRPTDEYTQSPLTVSGTDYEKIDWRTMPEIFDELYNADDADAESKYDTTVANINSQDKKLQLEQSSVEVEYKAVASEKEAVKKILDTNATSSFKYFS